MNEKEEVAFDAISIETYVVLTKKYLYCIDIDSLEWLFDPIPFENISTMQLSINNGNICVFKRRQPPKSKRACPFVILENDRMEEMIRFVKRVYQGDINLEYKDIFYFKNDQQDEKAFNLIQLTVTVATDVEVRFIDAMVHGLLEKMSIGWRSFFSSQSKVTWT